MCMSACVHACVYMPVCECMCAYVRVLTHGPHSLSPLESTPVLWHHQLPWCEQRPLCPAGPETCHRPIVQSSGPGSSSHPSHLPFPQQTSPLLQLVKPSEQPQKDKRFWSSENWGRWGVTGALKVLHQPPPVSPGSCPAPPLSRDWNRLQRLAQRPLLPVLCSPHSGHRARSKLLGK